ncbi:hypothetical protein M8818_007497 [Zalaria obscura]|uniref:Uncharacterized protein n=1 Tax=Zalaria obscura TaxID=2024903 RepID=A0ACC3S3M1_9PEZI
MSAPPTVPRSVSDYSTGGDDTPDDASRMRKPSGSLPRIPGLQEGRSNTMQQPGSIYSPLQTMTSVSSRPESTVRPSAASIRSMNHSRRHSSIDQTASGLSENISASSNRQSHRKQPSLDKTWTMGNTPSAATTPFNSRRISSAHGHSASLGGMNFEGQAGASSQADLDRGYFSGNEVDNRNKRNVLQKKSNASPSHSRVPSTSTDNGRSSVYMNKNRVVSSESIPEPVSPLMSPAASHYFGFSQGTRAVSSPQTQTKTSKFQQTPISPVVTRLEYNDSPSINAIASSPRSPTLAESDASSLNNATPSPASHSFSFFSKSRGSGLRVASDAITQNEKARIAAPEGINTIKESDIASPTRTGSTTPSTDTRSFDMQKADLQSRGSGGSSTGLAPPPSSGRGRPKTRSKKETSAYTRGLQKKTPAEQMVDCDYSGWMKKRSSNLISSWKPRLFVLRGRRLSYYYSENDTEEKGLIDISSHRVLPAENERITGLHATLTGCGVNVRPTTCSSSGGIRIRRCDWLRELRSLFTLACSEH